jgi:hypothetical protein
VTELLAALSFGAALGLGHPTEHVLRQTYIALHLAERLGMDGEQREVVYYASMLARLGCHIDAYEQAKWFGDDQAFKHDAAYVDDGDALRSVAFLLRHIGDGRPLAERVKAGVGFLADGRHDLEQMYMNHWRAASAFSEDLGLSDAVRDSVAQTFERWDGKGNPMASAARRCCRRLAWCISPIWSKCSITPVEWRPPSQWPAPAVAGSSTQRSRSVQP